MGRIRESAQPKAQYQRVACQGESINHAIKDRFVDRLLVDDVDVSVSDEHCERVDVRQCSGAAVARCLVVEQLLDTPFALCWTCRSAAIVDTASLAQQLD